MFFVEIIVKETKMIIGDLNIWMICVYIIGIINNWLLNWYNGLLSIAQNVLIET